MPTDYTAQTIQQGTESILGALRSKGAASRRMGEGIGGGVGALGVGVFKMAQRAKEEKDIETVDMAAKAVSAMGDPDKAFVTLGQLQTQIKTTAGKKYLLETVERFRQTNRDFIQDEATRATTNLRKKQAEKMGVDAGAAEVTKELVRRARELARTNPEAQPPSEILADPEAADAFREEQDQGLQVRGAIEKRNAERESEEMSNRAIDVLRGRSAEVLSDEELYAIQKDDPKLGKYLYGEREKTRRFETGRNDRKEALEFDRKKYADRIRRLEREDAANEAAKAKADASKDSETRRKIADAQFRAIGSQIDDLDKEIGGNRSEDMRGRLVIHDEDLDRELREERRKKIQEQEEWRRRMEEGTPAPGQGGSATGDKSKDALDKILDSMTPEQIQELLKGK